MTPTEAITKLKQILDPNENILNATQREFGPALDMAIEALQTGKWYCDDCGVEHHALATIDEERNAALTAYRQKLKEKLEKLDLSDEIYIFKLIDET